jgi:HEAT repeat protein
MEDAPTTVTEGEQPKRLVHSYASPVDRLLTYTSMEEKDPFPEISYVEKFGIGPEHIPELIRMATDDYLGSDDGNEFEFAAPLHAVNALTELHAEAAIEPLLTLYDKASQDDNEWMLETLVDFYTIIGPVALPALEQFLADTLHDASAQDYVAEIMSNMAKKHPEARTDCIAVATRRLEDFELNDPGLNESLISALLRMKAVEAAPLIQRAYASGRVDDFWGRDWDDAQYELGLKERPATPEGFSAPLITSRPVRSTTSITTTPVQKSTKKSPPSKKGKAKMVKVSKKVNRRKK